jgi:FixJ family two-component response regulator
MSSNQAPQQLSIFEEAKDGSLPVKPVRTEHDFGVPQRRSLSATGIQSRIMQFVRQESEATSTGLDVDAVNTTHSTAERKNVAGLKIERLLNLPTHPLPLFFTTTFSPLQEWEGYVRGIGPESISVDLVDITANAKNITEQAKIPLVELSDADRQKLRIGGVFRWSIGYQRTTSGTKMRVSNIAFRDLPRWTQKDIREAREEAGKLEQYFKVGRSGLPKSSLETASAKEPIVFVVEGDASMRRELTNLFQSVDLKVEVFSSTPEMLHSELPDVASCVIFDIKLPAGRSGLDLQTELAKANIHIPIIFITGHGDVTVRAMKDGAMDFLTKPFRDQDILDAVVVAIERDRKRREVVANLSETLTPREREILALVASGLMNKQIASVLRLSENTVKIHREHIIEKMDASSSADLVRKADTLGIHRTEP